MNHEIEFFNHKTRLAELRQETKDFGKSKSIKQLQGEGLSGAGIKQKLLGWMSKFKSQDTAKSDTSAAYQTNLQRE